MGTMFAPFGSIGHQGRRTRDSGNWSFRAGKHHGAALTRGRHRAGRGDRYRLLGLTAEELGQRLLGVGDNDFENGSRRTWHGEKVCR